MNDLEGIKLNLWRSLTENFYLNFLLLIIIIKKWQICAKFRLDWRTQEITITIIYNKIKLFSHRGPSRYLEHKHWKSPDDVVTHEPSGSSHGELKHAFLVNWHHVPKKPLSHTHSDVIRPLKSSVSRHRPFPEHFLLTQWFWEYSSIFSPLSISWDGYEILNSLWLNFKYWMQPSKPSVVLSFWTVLFFLNNFLN